MLGIFMDSGVHIAGDLMLKFAERTGLNSNLPPRRYLWTDSFAVCNFLALYTFSGDGGWLDLALKLVDQVHNVLGRHRGDDGRSGWISGLSDDEAREHPTIGGLRIGKKLPERRLDEPLDWNLEWDRDGQYYHYLTKWMHALNKVSIVTGDGRFRRWAYELAKKVHWAFTYTLPDGRRRMYWKMSIDLTRPLVESMGQHDPLDGYVTYNEIQATMRGEVQGSLEQEIKDIYGMIGGEADLATEDPLGIGELLSTAYRIAELIHLGYWNETELLIRVLRSAYLSLEVYGGVGFINLPSWQRLAFREFGLSIGLKSLMKLSKMIEMDEKLSGIEDLKSIMKLLSQYTPIAEKIEKFWMGEDARRSKLWKEYQDINEVMLATSLIPNGYMGVNIQRDM